jgi:hypothetical protein
MGWLKDLDAAIQGRLESIEAGGRCVLRMIGPLRAQGRSPVPAEMLAADKPALFYTIEQIGGDSDDTLARVQALLIAEDLRGPTGAWRGSIETCGAYELAEKVAQSLVTTNLAGTAGAWLRLQRLACADGRVVALLQEYDVLTVGQQVLLDGQDLLGGRSILRLTHATETARWQTELPAGSEECWAKWQGRGPSRIVLAGTIWATSEIELAGIEQLLSSLLADRQLHDLSLGVGGSWPDVAMISWQQINGRVMRPILGLLGQNVQIEFEQYRQ